MPVHIDITLAGYRLDAVIGQGGMGTVYRAEQLRLRRHVALKILAPDLAEDTAFRERFLRESQLAASLEHPHVVPVFDAGEADGMLYIAMRYIAGSDLRALIRQQAGISPYLTVRLLAQLGGALDAAHALGLVHLDVKPSNVLIAGAPGADDSMSCYLTDFGLSRPAVDRTASGAGGPLGSAHYMSPEQIRGEYVDARSDVYSVGCLLYECLTGEVPFARDSEAAVLYAHLEAPRPRLSAVESQLPAALDEVLASALAISPEDRPAGVGELARAVSEVLGQGQAAPPASQAATAQPMASPVPSARGETRPIVGRLEEEVVLQGALEEAMAGRGGVVLLVGEAGIGKTTLADQFSREAARRGVRVLWASGGSFGEVPPPYWHWVQIVRALARRPDGRDLFGGLGASAAWLAAIAPEIAASLPGVPLASEPAGANDGRFHVYDALAQLLVAAAGRRGLAIVLEDLHLADEASLLALAFIAALIRDAGVLILATYREGELAGAGAQRNGSSLTELARVSRLLPLGALAGEHVERLIAARTGGQAPRALVERVQAVTAGNPLFVSELLNLLEAQGKLTDPQLASSSLPLPTGIRDAISQRLAPLSARGREMLDVAAVIGESFRVGTLARASGIERAELLRLLDQTEQQGVVRPLAEPAGRYAFTHALVQATLYETLPRSRRYAIHAQVGEALEEDYDVAAGEGLAEAAYHFLAAAPASGGERALAYATRAAERAAETFAYDEAVTLYSRALEVAEPGRARERLELLLALGEAQMRAGDAEAARSHGDADALGRVALACNIWGLSSGVDELLVQLAEEAVEQLEDHGSPGLLAATKGLLAAALYWSDQVHRRERLAREALALARAEHERAPGRETARVLGYVLGRYLLTRWGPDSADEDLELSDELLALARETRDNELEILARNWRIAVLLEMGNFSGVDQEIARVEQMAVDLRQPRAMVFLLLHHATRAGTVGRFAEAERLNVESMETGRRVRGTVGELAAGAQLVAIRLQEGRLAELEPAVRTIANLHPGMVAFQCAWALSLIHSGRHSEAAAELERLMSTGPAGFPRDNTYIVMLAVLGEVAAELDDRDRAGELFSWLEPYAGRWVVSPGAAALWPVDRSLGRLATVAGMHDAALAHIGRAREQAARAGAAPSTALVALDEARLLAASGRAEDRARVGSLARQARELAQDLGMGLVVDAATLLEGETG